MRAKSSSVSTTSSPVSKTSAQVFSCPSERSFDFIFPLANNCVRAGRQIELLAVPAPVERASGSGGGGRCPRDGPPLAAVSLRCFSVHVRLCLRRWRRFGRPDFSFVHGKLQHLCEVQGRALCLLKNLFVATKAIRDDQRFRVRLAHLG